MSILEKLRKATDTVEELDVLFASMADGFPINSREHMFFYNQSENMTVLTRWLERELRFQEVSKLPCTCDCKEKSPGQSHAISCSRWMMDIEVPK